MALKVTRYGGAMVMKPKARTFDLDQLDPSTKEALGTLLRKGAPISVSERMPDGFVYAFEVEEAEQPKQEVEVSGTQVPEALRKLLP